MIYPNPKNIKYTGEELLFAKNASLYVCEKNYEASKSKLFCELYSGFTAGIGRLKIKPCDLPENVAVFCPEGGFFEKVDCSTLKSRIEKGDSSYSCDLPDGTAYSLKIIGEHAIIRFSAQKNFNYAFFTFLQLIEVRCSRRGEEVFALPLCEIQDEPALNGMRAVHICVFPETPYAKIRRILRLAAFLKYTHAVIELWGVYRYKCFKDFGRKHYSLSITKLKTLVSDANLMGLEIIPMLNVWGHASGNRAIYGKHTALDQNLAYSDLFDTSGWTWNLLNPEVLRLQKQMITELCDIFPGGSYFHIGCDEAYTYGDDRAYLGQDKNEILIMHINEIIAHVKAQGRRAIMWADMFLSREVIPKKNGLILSSKDEGVAPIEKQLAALDKSVILADWQYYTDDETLPTAAYLADKGFDVTVSPFDNLRAMKINFSSAEKNCYFGVIQTTWDTLFTEMLTLPHGACYGWEGSDKYVPEPGHRMRCYIAALYRKLYRNGRYTDDGLRRFEIES